MMGLVSPYSPDCSLRRGMVEEEVSLDPQTRRAIGQMRRYRNAETPHKSPKRGLWGIGVAFIQNRRMSGESGEIES
jgi:hypothetical protein